MTEILSRKSTSLTFKDEFRELKTIVFKEQEWTKLENFVKVEEPIRRMLRLTDGHEPNLSIIAPVFFETCDQVLSICAQIDDNLKLSVKSCLQKRAKDIVSFLACGAAMVSPIGLYSRGKIFSHEDGNKIIIRLIKRYFYDETEQTRKQYELIYQQFREKTGYFNTLKDVTFDSSDNFWSIAFLHLDSPVCVFFRKLINGFCGQGESERLNKLVKSVRTKVRNRQAHKTTQAFLKLSSYYTNMNRKENLKNQSRYLDLIREKINETKTLLQLQKDIEEEERIELEKKNMIENDKVEDDSNDNFITKDTKDNEDIEDEENEEEEEEEEDVAENILVDLLNEELN